jgi:hypothetical protein
MLTVIEARRPVTAKHPMSARVSLSCRSGPPPELRRGLERDRRRLFRLPKLANDFARDRINSRETTIYVGVPWVNLSNVEYILQILWQFYLASIDLAAICLTGCFPN